MDLSTADRDRIIDLIKNGQTLPKEDLYKLAADEEDVFLFWNGRDEAVTRAVLPFHHIEHIDEPRRETTHRGDAISMFDLKGRQRQGWHDKLIWGDNKLILSSLAHGPLREQIEAEGGLKLVYIDPPFAVGADFSHTIEIGGENGHENPVCPRRDRLPRHLAAGDFFLPVDDVREVEAYSFVVGGGW